MADSAILKMVEDAFYNHFFMIDVIVSNYDRMMRTVLKHPSKGTRGRVLNSSKGKLRTEISDPSFLADPSHSVKVVAKKTFPSSTKVGICDAGAPNQMPSSSKKMGGT